MKRTKEKRRMDRRAGLTLVEIVMALGVLLVAVMGAFSSPATSSNLITVSNETDIAMVDLQACMEQLLTLSSDVIPIPGSDYEQGLPVAQYVDLNLQNESIVATYPGYVVGQPVPDPLEIQLTITWNDYGTRTRTDTLTSVKSR